MTLPTVAAVIDTNVLLSGLIGKTGPPLQILLFWSAGRFSLVTSQPLLDELEVITLRPELSRRFEPSHLVALWRMIREGAVIVTPAAGVSVTADAVDNALFATAIAGGSRFVVTGDRKLLELEKVGSVQVVSPRVFVESIASH